MSGYRVGVVGATGAVGRTMVECLEQRRFPVRELVLFASPKSDGIVIHFNGSAVRVRPLSADALTGFDYLLFSAGATVSREVAPGAAKRGCVVIDNSSAFRMDADVPLVVPEVNAHALTGHKNIIANPNCSTIQLVVALKPLHDAARLRRVVVASYQAISGAGGRALTDFEHRLRSDLTGDRLNPATALNAVPQIGDFADDGYTVEEKKIIHESRKILGLPDLRITATAVRVPVRNAHSEAVFAEFEQPITPAKAREVLSKAPGVALAERPTPLEASGRDEVFVGRIRADASVPHGLSLWVVGDNLRKGAALNAVQIAERLCAASS